VRISSLTIALLLTACAGTPPPPLTAPAPPVPATAPTTTPPVVAAEAHYAPKAPVPLEEYFKVRRISSRNGTQISISHDEALIAYLSDEGGRADIWVQPIAGGPATQITHVDGFLHTVAFSPTEDKLVYEADKAGDELPHLFLTDAKGTAPKDIAADYPAGRRTDFVEWAKDGKSFLFLSSLRDEKHLDLCEYVVASGKVERLWEGSGKRSLTQVSRDHKRFAILEQNLRRRHERLSR
jgi:prolyl oligopeptidase